MAYLHTRVDDTLWEVATDAIEGCLTRAYVATTKRANYVIDTLLGAGSASHLLRHADPGLPTYVINTHHHWDHVWGNAFFPGAVLVCHERCRENLRDRWDGMLERYGRYVDGEARPAVPNVQFRDGAVLNDELELFHSPGHTDDSISVFYRERNVLFVGDNFGDDDEEIVPSLQDPDRYPGTLEKLLAFDAARYLSGHNEGKRKDFIRAILDRIRQDPL